MFYNKTWMTHFGNNLFLDSTDFWGTSVGLELVVGRLKHM